MVNPSEKNNEKGDGIMTTMLVSKIEELIQPNKRGKVTNAQMIPALVKAIEAGSKEQLDILKEGYPEVFEASSTKYLNKKHSAAFIKIMNGLPLDDEVAEATSSEVEPASEPEVLDELVAIDDETPTNEDDLDLEVENKDLSDISEQSDELPEVEVV